MTPTKVIFPIISTLITTATVYIIIQTFNHFCCMDHHLPRRKLKPAPSNTPSPSIGTVADNDNQSEYTQSKQYIFFRNATTTCCSFFAIQIATTNVDYIIFSASLYDPFYRIASIIIWSTYFIGRMVLLLIFIGRLKYTFEGTPFPFTKCVINSLMCIWCSMPFCCVLSALIIGIVGTATSIMFSLGVAFAVLFVFIDILLSCILLYIYLKKLYILTIATKDRELMAMTTKYTLLYSICYASTICDFLILVIRSLERVRNDEGESFQRVLWLFLLIDGFLNMLCLWLKLSSAQSAYSKLCGCVHSKCELCCRRCNRGEDMNIVIQNASTDPSPAVTAFPNAIEVHTTQNTAIIL